MEISEWKARLEMEREEKDRFFAQYGQSPIPAKDRLRFRGLAYYPPDPAYRFDLEHCNVNGGFVFGPSNVLFKEIPPKHTVAMYEAVD